MTRCPVLIRSLRYLITPTAWNGWSRREQLASFLPQFPHLLKGEKELFFVDGESSVSL